jgi:hypothetical protein
MIEYWTYELPQPTRSESVSYDAYTW